MVGVKEITSITLSGLACPPNYQYIGMVVRPLHPIIRDFILFCRHRKPKREWPALYDEMCWVAGHRLFRGLGYSELRQMGLSFALTNIDDTIRLVDTVTSQEREPLGIESGDYVT